MPKRRIDVFVSSTIDDLKDYRDAAKNEILTFRECRPVMKEDWPAEDINAVKKCMDEVDGAEIYIGIYAHRYGFCPKDSKISITEMEFNRARENGIPCLCFLIEPKHPWNPELVEGKSGKTKLTKFKKGIEAGVMRAIFTTPESLAREVGRALRVVLATFDNFRIGPFPVTKINPPLPPENAAAYRSKVQVVIEEGISFDQDVFKRSLSLMLGVDHNEIAILRVINGSIIVDIELPLDAANKLYQAYLSYQLKDSRFPCHRIPQPQVFAGRVRELEDLKKALDGDQPVAITALRGVGGIGKTTLAQQVAHELGDKFGLKIYATLGEKFDESRLPEILRNWSQQDFPQDATIEQMIAITKNALTNADCGENVLALIDDVWPGDSVRCARRLRDALPDGARVLITTRTEKVAADLNARTHRLPHMPPNEGADLMLKHLEDTPAADHRAKLEELSAVLGGHPLALTLVARLLRQHFTPHDLDDTIKILRDGLTAGDSFENLELDGEGSDEKEDNVSVTLRLTLDRLGGNDADLNAVRQKQFRALGALPPDFLFSDTYIAALWGGEDRKALRELISEGLLDDAPRPEKVPDNSEWYTQHRLLRAYARGLARETNELDAAFNHYADAVIETADQFYELPPEEWGVLEADLPHVQVVGDTLVEMYKAIPDDADLQARASNFAFQSYPYLNYRREVRRIEWLEMGLAASRAQSDQRRELLFLNQIGLNYDGIGEKYTALKYYEQKLPIERALSDQFSESATLNNIGKVWDDLGEKHRALDFFEQALSLIRAVGYQGGEATTLINIGKVWDALGEKRRALDFFEQALPLLRNIGDRRGEATSLNNIGLVHQQLGENQKALDLFEQALSLFRTVGDRRGETTSLNNIGLVYQQLGENQRALDFFEQALPIFRAVGDRSGEATVLSSSGVIYRRLGENHKALDLFKQALPIFRAVGNRSGEANTLNSISYLYFQFGESGKAAEILKQVIGVYQELGAVDREAAMRFNLAAVLQQLNRIDEAIDHVRQAITLSRKYDLSPAQLGGTLAQAEAFLKRLETQKRG